MTAEPTVPTLPYWRRTLMFWALLIIFVVILPIVIFYTSGYRISLTQEGARTITQTGGAFIGSYAEDVDLYFDGEIPQDRRPFSQAFYVQGYDPGVYQVRTQALGLETWVKEIPVYPQMVTEVFAFNIPRTPQIRVITEYTTVDGVMVADQAVASSSLLINSSTTNTVVATSTTASTARLQNPEYTQLERLFASTTAERTARRNFYAARDTASSGFRFGSEVLSVPTTTEPLGTSTVFADNKRLYQEGEEIYVEWTGSDPAAAPRYFCVPYESPASTSEKFGAHVYESLVEEYASTTREIPEEFVGQELCRSNIRIDRKWQSVQWFDFVPGTTHLVLLQLQDGIYVVEVDDRAWQNVQLLYPGDYLTVVLDNGQILVQDGDVFVEVFTELVQ